MLVLIKNTISRESESEFDDVTQIVGVVESEQQGIELIKSDFELEFGDSEEYELDWSEYDNQTIVRISIKEEFGDNTMFECGYVLEVVS